MNTELAEAHARVLKAIAHPTRLLILETLSRGDCSVTDLRHLAPTSFPTLTHHLEKLKRVGIVTEKRVGKKNIHHLATPCILKALTCSHEALQSVSKRYKKGI